MAETWSGVDQGVEIFLSASKEVAGELRWQKKSHKDFFECRLPILNLEGTTVNGTLIMTANASRLPRQFSFRAILANRKILGLDVNPTSPHINVRLKRSIRGTHWHEGPMEEARADEREMSHVEWLGEFLNYVSAYNRVKYLEPPFVEIQGDLL